jgi:acetyltransferase-like isoleucine patch superfamily enzyme
MQIPRAKEILAAPLALAYRFFATPREFFRRLRSYARLRVALSYPLPSTTVVLGRIHVFGSGRIRCGEGLLLYPDLHFETQNDAEIELGNGIVISRGVHLVAFAGVSIGDGTMIGEYTSIRDANHARLPETPMRDAGNIGRPIVIGSEVWIGRGAAILAGVTIGDGATVGANAVVTRDVPAGATVAGVPARPIVSRSKLLPNLPESPG